MKAIYVPTTGGAIVNAREEARQGKGFLLSSPNLSVHAGTWHKDSFTVSFILAARAVCVSPHSSQSTEKSLPPSS